MIAHGAFWRLLGWFVFRIRTRRQIDWLILDNEDIAHAPPVLLWALYGGELFRYRRMRPDLHDDAIEVFAVPTGELQVRFRCDLVPVKV